MSRYKISFCLSVYCFLILNPSLTGEVDLGCPKLDDPPHGGYICADAIKRENKNNFYDVRVCAPNCRTGYVVNINNTVLFCTTTSKVWRLLPEDHAINDLQCVPTVNILYHNNEDRLQVRIQDFIEGKMPVDLNSSYPKLLEKSDIKDALEIFNTDQHSDINTIKRNENIIGSSIPPGQTEVSNLLTSHPKEDNLDYYSLKTEVSSDDFVNPAAQISTQPSNQSSKPQDDIVNESELKSNLWDRGKNDSPLPSHKKINKVNEIKNIEPKTASNESNTERQFNSSLFQSPLGGLKYLIGTVASPKNKTKSSIEGNIELATLSSYNEPASVDLITTTQPPNMGPVTLTSRDNFNQQAIPPQVEWTDLESRFVDNSPIYTQTSSYPNIHYHQPVEDPFPLFDEADNAYTRNNISGILLPQLPTQLNISPIEIHMDKLDRKKPTPATSPPSIDYRMVAKGEVGPQIAKVYTSSHIEISKNVKDKKNGTKQISRVNLSKAKKSSNIIKKSVKIPKSNPSKKVHYINLITKLKDGSISMMTPTQRTKLIRLIKNKTKLTTKTYCAKFYPVCKMRYNKRNIKYFGAEKKSGWFWTFPSS